MFYICGIKDADLTLAPPGDPLTALGRFSIVAMGSKVAVQTENVRALGAASFISNGTYPEGSVIPVIVTFSVEVCTQSFVSDRGWAQKT